MPTFNHPRPDTTSYLVVSVHAMVSVTLGGSNSGIQRQTPMLKSNPNFGTKLLADGPGGTVPAATAVEIRCLSELLLHKIELIEVDMGFVQ